MRGALALAALLLATPTAATAQDLDAAKAFVTGLYDAYHSEPGPDYLGRQSARVFAPALLVLMRRERAATPQDEVGALNGDPICGCQDYEITDVTVTVAAHGPNQARAEVRFQNFGRPRKMTLDLVAVRGGWRVADTHSTDLPSLVDLLTESLEGRR